MKETMKVMVVNSSPRMDKGNTALILNPFIEGMEEKGAEVEIYYTNKLKINPCQGDMTCMRSIGNCFQKDDMEWLLPNVNSADILVMASPLYCDGVTGPMKMFMDRLVPSIHLTMEIRDNHVRHPVREEMNLEKVVLVSNCGLWEMDNFDPMINHIKAYCKNLNAEYVGALLRPHAPVLRPMLKNKGDVSDIIESARKAGYELIEYGKISSETMNNISRPIISKEDYINIVNQE